jgi:hypothetical protein
MPTGVGWMNDITRAATGILRVAGIAGATNVATRISPARKYRNFTITPGHVQFQLTVLI